MSFPRQVTRVDAKLGVILAQMRQVRGRLNSLAWQHILFMSLAAAIAGGAVIVATAYLLGPLAFLFAAAFTAIVAVGALARAAARGWRMRASVARAAAIADRRAELKGRLETVVALARDPHPGPLWAYLVEDTLQRRAEFAPARVERRIVSRSLYAFAGAVLLALAVYPLTRLKRPQQLAQNGVEAELNLDINDLNLRPAEPGEEADLSVNADPDTIAKLEAKAAREGDAARSERAAGPLGNLMNQARSLAGNVQRKLTGDRYAKSHVTLHLSDSGDQFARNGVRGSGPGPDNGARHGEQAGQFKHEKLPGEDKELPQTDPAAPQKEPEEQADANAQPPPDNATSGNAAEQNNESNGGQSASARGERSSSGGSAHGIGADPDSLFGAPLSTKLGNEGFEIAIAARPMDKGSKGSGHAYVPPRVNTPLSAVQEPDEPVARSEVPPQDAATVRRVFDR
jgi:hypothetical protein